MEIQTKTGSLPQDTNQIKLQIHTSRTPTKRVPYDRLNLIDCIIPRSSLYSIMIIRYNCGFGHFHNIGAVADVRF